jgi:hypothetical protein
MEIKNKTYWTAEILIELVALTLIALIMAYI